MVRLRSRQRCATLISTSVLFFGALFLISLNWRYSLSDEYVTSDSIGDSGKCSCEPLRDLKSVAEFPKSGMSSCSKEASEYGPGQKVISFSMYVTDESDVVRYSSGLEPNLETIPLIYPYWLVRVYTNISRNHENSCRLICKYKNLFWCDINNIPGFGDLSRMNPRAWRFLALGDPNVEVFISRDLDSVVSEREQIAVRQWLESNYTVHAMRDHPEHNVELLGGMWGVKTAELSQDVTLEMQRRIIEETQQNQSRGWDEVIIARNVYWPTRTNVLAHDSYHCGEHRDGLTLPFSTRRQGHSFVGQVSIRNNYTTEACPVSCRPIYGKLWTSC